MLKYLKFYNCFTSNNFHCWKCGQHNSQTSIPHVYQCASCKSLQSIANNQNFFEIFKLPFAYDINTSDLTRKVRLLQALTHPDKYSKVVTSPDRELEIANENSSLINKAAKILGDPLQRAKYLLKLHGREIGEDDKHGVLEESFLNEILDINQRLVEIDDDKMALNQLDKENNEKIAVLIKKLCKNFAENNLDAAYLNTQRLTYYQNVKQKIFELHYHLLKN